MKHGKTALAVSSFENYEIVYQNVDEMLRSRAAWAKADVKECDARAANILPRSFRSKSYGLG